MSRFIAGVLLGLLGGAAATTYAATCVRSGELPGWSVFADGEQACKDPVIDTNTKEIDCR